MDQGLSGGALPKQSEQPCDWLDSKSFKELELSELGTLGSSEGKGISVRMWFLLVRPDSSVV